MSQPQEFFDSTRKITLNNGVQVPIVGQGAWAPPDPESQSRVKDWVLTSIKNGYRHIDTAQLYGTERAVGEAVRESGIPREEFFITTKLAWNHEGHRVRSFFEKSLAELDLGYIDLYLMHYPQTISYVEGNYVPIDVKKGSTQTLDSVTFNETWAEMEKLLETGKVRAIGVSNFSVKTLEGLLKTAKVVPAMNQVELHPYLAQNGLREYCQRKGITLTAYTPTGYDIVRSDPLINSLAKKYNVSAAQIIFSWHLSRDTVIVPKSENSERQKQNITIPVLSPEDLEKIWTLDIGRRTAVGPMDNGYVWGWTLEKMGWDDYKPRDHKFELALAAAWEQEMVKAATAAAAASA